MKNANFYLMNNRFGDLIRMARLERGWSQRELARRIKKSPTYIHYVERGINPSSKRDKIQVGADAVDSMAQVLGIPIDEARNAAGYAPTSEHYVAGFRIELPDDVSAVMPFTTIRNETEAEEFRQAFLVAYELTKSRLAKEKR